MQSLRNKRADLVFIHRLGKSTVGVGFELLKGEEATFLIRYNKNVCPIRASSQQIKQLKAPGLFRS